MHSVVNAKFSRLSETIKSAFSLGGREWDYNYFIPLNEMRLLINVSTFIIIITNLYLRVCVVNVSASCGIHWIHLCFPSLSPTLPKIGYFQIRIPVDSTQPQRRTLKHKSVFRSTAVNHDHFAPISSICFRNFVTFFRFILRLHRHHSQWNQEFLIFQISFLIFFLWY